MGTYNRSLAMEEAGRAAARRSNAVGLLLFVLALAFGVAWFGNWYNTDLGCIQYIKRAADASDPAVGAENLDRAIAYAEVRGLTHGNSSLLASAPTDDLGFWYRNLRQARADLRALAPDAPALTRSNVLMRVREVLIDQTQTGPKVTAPSHLALYPHQRLIMGGSILFGLLFTLWVLASSR